VANPTTALPTAARKQPQRRRRMHDGQTIAHPVVRILKGVLLVVVCGLILMPFLGIVSTSVAPESQITSSGGFVLIPESINLDAYKSILAGGVVTRALAISVFITVVGTALSLVATTLLAYALSRKELVGRGVLMALLLLSLLFTPGLIPTYLAVKQFGLLDSLWALIIPTMVSAFNVIVVRSFFQSLPQELLDAARIDGAGHWQVFTRIVLPLSKAILAVVGLFYAVGYWNSFFNGLLYLNDSSLWPLQLVLRTYVVNGSQLSSPELGSLDAIPPQPAIQMAILVISIVPIICVYPFLQKHMTKGVLTGAVKG
jgi:putative aldouronate transport system permease protein